MKDRKIAAIYARVSTKKQEVESQLLQLREVASRNGWQVAQEYIEIGVSGAKGRDKRQQLNSLLESVTRREVDVVMAWSVDRLGRSLKDVLAFMDELKAKETDLYLHQQAIDTTTPGGKALFQMLGVFAEFERALIVDRVHTGLERARAAGKRLGRPPIKPGLRDEIVKLHAAGESMNKIAERMKVGSTTVRRVLKSHREQQAA